MSDKKQYYDYTDAFALSGLSYADWYDLQVGKLKKEEDILPELFLSEEDESNNNGRKYE